MKKFMFLKGLFHACLFIVLIPGQSMGQDFAASNPKNILRPVGLNTVSINLSGYLEPLEIIIPNYYWIVSPSAGVSISHPDPSIAQATASFTSAASGIYTFTLKRGIKDIITVVQVGNLAAASNDGLDISIFNVLNGTVTSGSGPGFMFDPLPDPTTTAALGIAINGYYYFMPNNFNTGNVILYAASPNGQTINSVANIDLNGSSNNNLGFVRLAMDPAGMGWMLAGDGTSVYMANFVANGLGSTTITLVDESVTVVGSTASVFQNGDLCFSGAGTLFALANNGGGVTQIFTGTPNGSSTSLTKKWDLVDATGNNFTGNVNGVAFDFLGSLYISTGGTTGGLFYIDQNTVNTATGTVQCSLVWSGTGLTDLASNLFPQQTTLPVRILSFSGRYQNKVASLTWDTEGEQYFSHFEIERSNNGNNYFSAGTKPASGIGNGRKTYQFTDDLSSVSGYTFTYRLKLVDLDGKFKYSNVIMIRREVASLQSIELNPNPVINGMATIRFFASSAGSFDFRVVDLSGKTVLKQNEKLFEGNNSVSLNGLDRLPKGSYILQVLNGNQLQAIQFTIAR